MFGSLGFNEILFIMVLALLIFGPKRLPEIGRTVGKTLGEFRRATSDLKRSMEVEMSMAEERESSTADNAPRLAAGSQPRTADSSWDVEPGNEPGDEADFGVVEAEVVDGGDVDETSAEMPTETPDETPDGPLEGS